MIIRRPRHRRHGATTVEFAVVSILLFLMLFGIFEYARFLFVYHMTTNAAREAARFAVVHTSGGTMSGEPGPTPIITSADQLVWTQRVQDVWQYGTFNGQAYGVGMCGMENQLAPGWTFDVFAVPDSSLYASPQDLNPTGKPNWTTATFHQQICVRISGTYKPVVPNLIGMNSNVPFTVTVLMSSEGN